jgi:hypothetical protein
MRRSICYCEPNHTLAGEIYTWQFIYTTASALPKGTLLRFDMMSDGREIDWELPSVDLKEKTNVIYGKLENGKVLAAKEVEIPDSWAPQYEFELPAKVEAGSSFTIVVGSPKLDKNLMSENGTQAQTYSQRRRPFLLYIDTTGKKQFEEPEMFSMDIKGNELTQIKVLTPSFVQRNKRFDVVARFEDDYGNLTSNAHDDTLIELSHEHLRENLSWKLFVPETGFITIPNLYFNEEGFYTIQLKNTHTNAVFRSSPIKCFADNTKSLYWGILHGESVRVDSTENIDSCLRHFRDEKSMNFYASSCFEDQEETPNEIWKTISQNLTEFDEQERFTTFLGFQWQGAPKTEGVRQFIWAKDGKPILRKKDAKYSSLKKIYKSYTPKDFIAIPTFTMGKGFEYDFKNFDPEFERVVEIYNSWGSSECSKKEGNSKPIKGSARNGIQESSEGSIIQALKANKRFGFVAGGLDDRGIYSNLFESDQEQYSPGLTAIISKEHNRTALYENLYNRSCYATTGERIILGNYVAGLPMGSETTTAEKPGLNYNRHLSGYVAGTDKLQKVEIIRNGEVLKTFETEDYHLDYTYDDLTSLKDVCLDAKDKNPPFVFYYLRVTQEDGHMAWSSPVWIDLVDDAGIRKAKAKAVKA